MGAIGVHRDRVRDRIEGRGTRHGRAALVKARAI
jgi:hypothetical protein